MREWKGRRRRKRSLGQEITQNTLASKPKNTKKGGVGLHHAVAYSPWPFGQPMQRAWGRTAPTQALSQPVRQVWGCMTPARASRQLCSQRVGARWPHYPLSSILCLLKCSKVTSEANIEVFMGKLAQRSIKAATKAPSTTKAMRAMVDTGATHNFIHEVKALRLGLGVGVHTSLARPLSLKLNRWWAKLLMWPFT